MDFKEIKKLGYSTYLHLRFPFLYPRNRFDGRHHYYSEYLARQLSKWDSRAYKEMYLGYKFYKDPSQCIETNRVLFLGTNIRISLGEDSMLVIYNLQNGERIEYDLQKHVGSKFTITGLSVTHSFLNTPIIQFHCHINEVTDVNYGFSHKQFKLCVDKNARKMYNIIHWIWGNIVNRVMILDSHTELDAMEDGWRMAFGLRMCEDIKKALLHTYTAKYNGKNPFKYAWLYMKGVRALYRYRVMQIKEKWAKLEWYDAWSTEGVREVIRKYGEKSKYTCITCGKPAKYITKGYYLPYCEEHIEEKEYAYEIDKYYKR